jgi:hypothetical protein
MLRLAAVFATVLALAVLSAPVATTQDAPATKAPKQVVVTARCPTNGHGPLTVTVNPWTVDVSRSGRDDTRWILNTSHPQTNSIKIEAKETSGWPYPDRVLSADGEVTFENMDTDTPLGDCYYNITLYCGEDRVVIDPRVRVGP